VVDEQNEMRRAGGGGGEKEGYDPLMTGIYLLFYYETIKRAGGQ